MSESEWILNTLLPNEIVGEEGLFGVDDYVIWVGDLDGDNEPDLLVRPQDRPDYLELELFLSKERETGVPWISAARYYWWDASIPGC